MTVMNEHMDNCEGTMNSNNGLKTNFMESCLQILFTIFKNLIFMMADIICAAMQDNQQTVANRKSAGANWSSVNNNNNNKNNNKENGIKPVDVLEDEHGTTTKLAAAAAAAAKTTQYNNNGNKKRKLVKWGNRHVSMDCEMVGIGRGGHDDMLARVSIVNRHGCVLLDKYVKPTKDVVNYRTEVSGIRPQDIANGEDFKLVQSKVIEILDGKVLVGHGLRKDLKVLKISHPHYKVRDTTAYKPLAKLVSGGRTPSLKKLAHAILGDEIQSGEHDSVEDARAVMKIYNLCCTDWEETLKRKYM